MAYNLDRFVADCRTILTRDDGPAGREEVRRRLEELLSEPEALRQLCSDTKPGRTVLYEDAKLGFQVLLHVGEKAHVSPPHDHGASWAIYGQAAEYTDMTEWERVGDAGAANGPLELRRKYRLTPGRAGIYQDGMIHSIDYPANAIFVRITGANLDRIARSRFDAASGKAMPMLPPVS